MEHWNKGIEEALVNGNVAAGQVASGTQEKSNWKALVNGCSHWAGRQWDMVNGTASRL